MLNFVKIWVSGSSNISEMYAGSNESPSMSSPITFRVTMITQSIGCQGLRTNHCSSNISEMYAGSNESPSMSSPITFRVTMITQSIGCQGLRTNHWSPCQPWVHLMQANWSWLPTFLKAICFFFNVISKYNSTLANLSDYIGLWMCLQHR